MGGIFDTKGVTNMKIGMPKSLNRPIGGKLPKTKLTIPRGSSGVIKTPKTTSLAKRTKKGISRVTRKNVTLLGQGRKEGMKLTRKARLGRI